MVICWLYIISNQFGYNDGINLGREVVTMFEIQKLDKANKQSANIPRTIRFTEDLFNNYNKLSEDTGVSFNTLVLEAMKYAYNDLKITGNK